MSITFVDAPYELLEKLGDGGMGSVFRARDKRLNRFVAIKVLRADSSRDSSAQRRFVLEAQAASGLNHPNIVTIHDLAEQNGEQMIVMECVAGISLAELIRDRPLTVEQVSAYGAQIADALTAAHRAGIVHRDLKPSNVMVTDRGLVKVLDFGIAKLLSLEASESDRTRSYSPLTMQGTLVGTIAYMSPEQAQGQPVDARSDIFSFGAMLYEMVTGKRAFEGSTLVSTLTSILQGEARPIPEIAPHVPPELQTIVYHCLRKQPEQRYQTMAQVHDALLALRRPHKPLAPASKKKSQLPVVLAALSLLAIGGGGWFLWSRPQQSSTAVSRTQSAANTLPKTLSTKPPDPTAPVPQVPPQKAAPPASSTADRAPQPSTPSLRRSAPAAKSILVYDGTPLRLALVQEVPADAAEGTPLTFVVAADLVVNGDIVIAKGATEKGVIVDAGRKRRLLGNLKATYRLVSADAVDGKSLLLRTTPTKPGEAGKRSMIGTAPGSEFPAYVDGDSSVGVHAP